MPRRIVLTARQRSFLFDLPTDEASLLKYYTLADDDIVHIRTRRKAHNRLGFALQLCAFRYPGRFLTAADTIPGELVKFIAAQLGMQIDDLDGYAIREETRREHLLELRALYGYRTFKGQTAGELRDWLYIQAEDARSNVDLAHRFVERCRILGYQFIPHIRDLPSKRLYVFNPGSTPQELRGLVGGKIREKTIVQNWPDIVRSAATMAAGIMPPSQLLRKFASYPRQHDLALAFREIGRIERTLFLIDWVLDIDMQRRARIGLNKGEAHHALKNALRIGRQGEVRDRTTEGQHYRLAGLNLLAAIVIYWNSVQLGHAVTKRQKSGLNVPPELLAHISPLGWAHILLTGEYRWPK